MACKPYHRLNSIKEQIRSDYEAGKGSNVLAVEHGSNPNTIRALIKRAGGTIRSPKDAIHIRNGNCDGLRRCFNCKELLPLTQENFHRCRRYEFAYICKQCSNSVRKIRNRTAGGLLRSYRRSDRLQNKEFDLTLEFLEESIVGQPCYYCGSIEEIGMDRKDNSLGHVKANVVPCCYSCNFLRKDKLNVEDMKMLGEIMNANPGLREILHKRLPRNAIERAKTAKQLIGRA